MAPLHGAIPLAQINRIFVLVGNDLNFDVARVLEKLLHIHRRVVERCAGLGLGHGHGVDQRRLGVHYTHAAPAAAARRFDDHRVAHRLGNALDLYRVFRQFPFRSRHAGHARTDHGLLGRHLIAHDADGLRGWPDELEAAFLNALGKIGVFAQETIAGVDGLCIGHLGGRNNRRHIEVAQGRRRRSNANRFFSQLDVLGLAVRLGIDHHGLDAQLAAGALDTQRNFATVGDQYFLEHGLGVRFIR